MIWNTSQKPLRMKFITQEAKFPETAASINHNVIQWQHIFRAGAIKDFLKYPQSLWLASFKYTEPQGEQATPKSETQFFSSQEVH